MIAGGLVVVVAIVVAIVLSLGGSSKGGNGSTATTGASGSESTATQTRTTHHAKTSSPSSRSAPSANAAATNVVVLNGTGTTGLAHRVSAELQQHGYAKATPLSGTPPGANQVTVVEYASGHQAEAQSVARTLGVSQAQPIEGTVASMAGSAPVVVVVGLDKASSSP